MKQPTDAIGYVVLHRYLTHAYYESLRIILQINLLHNISNWYLVWLSYLFKCDIFLITTHYVSVIFTALSRLEPLSHITYNLFIIWRTKIYFNFTQKMINFHFELDSHSSWVLCNVQTNSLWSCFACPVTYGPDDTTCLERKEKVCN